MNPEALAEEIRESAEEFMGMISKFNDEQLNTNPLPGSWTAGQVADHIIKSVDGIPDTNTRTVDRSPDEQVDPIKSMFLDFTVKFKSPDFVIPGEGPFQTRAIQAELQRIKNQNAFIVTTRDLTKVCMDFAFPGFGYLTRYEWFKFIIFHTQRHIHQLKDIQNKVFVIKV